MRPQAIFFDLDDTLLDDAASIDIALEATHAEICDGIPDVDVTTLARTYLTHSDDYWLSQPFARNDIEDIRRELWRRALADLGCDDLECVRKAAQSYSSGRAVFAELYPDTLQTLDSLHGRYKLAVVTNGSGPHQRSRLQHSGLDRYFDVVVASTDLDSGKPEPAIFLHVLQRLGIPATDAWHVGDRLHHDVAGAHNAGLTAVWINRIGLARDALLPAPHHEITSLSRLPDLLEALP